MHYDQSDGYDEGMILTSCESSKYQILLAILPLAVEEKDSFIIDNELHDNLVRPLPPGCTLMVNAYNKMTSLPDIVDRQCLTAAILALFLIFLGIIL